MITAVAIFHLLWAFAIGWTCRGATWTFRRKLPGIWIMQPDIELFAAIVGGGVVEAGLIAGAVWL